MGIVISFPRVAPATVALATPPPARENPCPVCSYRATHEDDDVLGCDRCKILLHGTCYWGRVASLDEWREWLRQVYETNDEVTVPVLCAPCRDPGSAVLE